MKTNFIQQKAAAAIFGVDVSIIKKVQIWWKVVLIVGKGFSRFVSKSKFLSALRAAFNDVLFNGLTQLKQKPNNETNLQQINSQLPEGFKVSYETNLFGDITYKLWREEKKGRKIVNSFKLCEFENKICKFTTYWRSRLISPECRYKKAGSPAYLVTIAKDYKTHLEAKQAKADLGI
jgi:hypothetical protein